jgi:hypothetical protein
MMLLASFHVSDSREGNRIPLVALLWLHLPLHHFRHLTSDQTSSSSQLPLTSSNCIFQSSEDNHRTCASRFAMPSTKGLADLPFEVRSAVAANLSNLDLKNLRRSCSTFNPICARILFEKIRLVPCSGCLDWFSMSMHGSSAAHYVKHITYDDRWHLIDRALSQGKCAQLERRDDNYALGHDTVLELARDEYEFEDDLEHEVDLLHDVFNTLPHLTSIRVNEEVGIAHIGSDELDVPMYFKIVARAAHVELTLDAIRNLGVFRCEIGEPMEDDRIDLEGFNQRRRATIAVLRGLDLAGVSLTNFATNIHKYGTGTPWEENRGPWALRIHNQFDDLISRLHTLELNFNACHEHTWCCMDVFAEILKKARSLTSLLLSFKLDMNYAWSHCGGWNDLSDVKYSMDRFADSFSALTSLEDLTLQGFMCSESDLYDFLDHNQLESVKFHDLYVMSDFPQAPRACLIELLEYLKRRDFKNVELTGVLWNGGLQRINFDPRDRQVFSKELIQHVKMWIADVLDDTPNPLEALKIDTDFGDVCPSRLERRTWRFLLLLEGARNRRRTRNGRSGLSNICVPAQTTVANIMSTSVP